MVQLRVLDFCGIGHIPNTTPGTCCVLHGDGILVAVDPLQKVQLFGGLVENPLDFPRS